MRLSTGVDVIEIERIGRTLDRFGERFLQRIYTQGEIQYCRGRVQSLAGRFAAKEATSKALGIGMRRIRWRDIEILPDPRGKPQVFLHGRAASVANLQGIDGLDVSITHSRSDAVAMVVAWSEKQ